MSTRNKCAAAATLLAALVAIHAGVARAASAPSATETFGNQHADLKAAITRANVHSLRAAWFVRTAGPVSATPIHWRGSVLLSDWSGRVWRLNALSGKLIWRRRLDTPDGSWPWYGLAGTGVLANGVLIEVGVEGTAWGLDAATGKILWQAYLGGDPDPNLLDTSDPDAKYVGNLSDLLYGDGLVYVGMSSCDEPLAEANPLFVPRRGDRSSRSTRRPAWCAGRPGSCRLAIPGVPVWSSFALDRSTGILHTDTGNNYTSPATAWSDAVLALRAQTGGLLWATQLTAGDRWPTTGPDDDFGAGPQLFSAPGPGGTTLKLVGAMQKDGTYSALDRATGAIVWRRQLASGLNGSRGEASVGGGRLFAWADGRSATGTRSVVVAALATATGVPIWHRTWAKAGMLTDAGFLSRDVYFVGDAAGSIRAYRSLDGKLLWQGATPGHAVVCSSLWVAGRYLYLGIGLPNEPQRPYGLVAYRVP